METTFVFTPDHTLVAKDNVAQFIRQCQELCESNGDKWEQLRWPSIKFSKLGARNRSGGKVPAEDMLAAKFIDFTKSFFLYCASHNPRFDIVYDNIALKVLERALLNVTGDAGIWGCTLLVLDEAVLLAQQHYTNDTPYKVCTRLQKIAIFLSQHKLAASNIRSWKNPSRHRPRSSLGYAEEKVRQSKLPDEEALTSVAEIFATNPQLPRDVFVTSFVAMAMCAPSRASEILALPVSAEITVTDSEGIDRYGWRFFSGKGFEGDVKWVPSSIQDVGKTAFARMIAITAPGRALAKWIEEHPDQFYRHELCPDVSEDEPLTMQQAATALGFKSSTRQLSHTALRGRKLVALDGVHTLRSLWKHLLGRLPKDFPWLDKGKKIRFSEALFCTLRNQLHASRGIIPVELQVIPYNFFDFDLGPRENVEFHVSLFDRHGYLGKDGSPLKLKTHQPRHLLNTIAHRAGMSQEYIAKWSGRASVTENRTYNHTTDAENISKIRYELISAPPRSSIQSDSSVKLPVSENEFSAIIPSAMHVTEFGFCLHNYIMSPCEKYRDCINCSEQACVVGDDQKLARLHLRLKRLESALDLALEEEAEAILGADRWVAHHKMTINRIREMISLLSESELPDGSLIRLTGESFSHIQRAISSTSYKVAKES
ncbi:hypothetical protein ALP94_02614 [Pseudomonas savastanoi pv. glycinea]|nr:hypothetical protein ALP94_02614 [Pseudomonas savastanoi pv. glycinea]